jgi:hypothetical protein
MQGLWLPPIHKVDAHNDGNFKYYATSQCRNTAMHWAIKSLDDRSWTAYRHTDSATPPEFRSNHIPPPRPSQNEYPVWYFLTGSLSKLAYLARLLKLEEGVHFSQAWATGLVEVKERQCMAIFRASTGEHSRYNVNVLLLT